MRILVAEDDAVLADGVSQALRQSGYAVDWVKNGLEADSALSAAEEFDLLILDLGLPKKSGLEVLRGLRSSDSRLPVLILTALDAVSDRVRGLDAGADDYLAKPFDLAELEARVRALTRRGMAGSPTLLHHGALKYDQIGRVASLNGAPLELSARELSLIYKELAPGVSYKTYALTSTDQARIRDKASEFSLANEAGKTSVSIESSDLVMGTYNPATGEITPTNTGVRAVIFPADTSS
jgi:CheY-like chemotaxis protein